MVQAINLDRERAAQYWGPGSSWRVDPYLHSALSGKEQDLGAAEPPRTYV